jgi:hypothetical protein
VARHPARFGAPDRAVAVLADGRAAGEWAATGRGTIDTPARARVECSPACAAAGVSTTLDVTTHSVSRFARDIRRAPAREFIKGFDVFTGVTPGSLEQQLLTHRARAARLTSQ